MVNSVSIASHKPQDCSIRFSVSGGDEDNKLFIDATDSDKKRAIRGRILDIVNERKRAVACLAALVGMGTTGFCIYVVLCLLPMVYAGVLLAQGIFLPAVLLVLLGLVAICLLPVGLSIEAGRWSRIYLANPHEKPENFFQRNRDKIVLGMLMLVLGWTLKIGWDWARARVYPPNESAQEQTEDSSK